MIVQTSVTPRFLDCYATSAANLRGAKQRKKVWFTTAFGGARVETNIRKSIEPVSWNQAKGCARDKSRKSTELNNYIEESRIKLHRIYMQLEENGELITARILQEKFFGVDKKVEQVRTIIGTMREHNEQCRTYRAG